MTGSFRRYVETFLVGCCFVAGIAHAADDQMVIRWEYARLIIERAATWQGAAQPKFTRYTSSITLDRADGKPVRESITQDGKPDVYGFNDVIPPPYAQFYQKITGHRPPKDSVLDNLLLLNAIGEQGWEFLSPVHAEELRTMDEGPLQKREFLLKRAMR
jgi:hypothetical protein